MEMFSKTLMEGKVILMTGGSRGGMLKQMAQQYLQHGAKVVVLMSRNKEKNESVCRELQAYGNCESIPGDVRKQEDSKRVVSQIIEKYNKVDVLVNGAAGNFLAQASKMSLNGFKTVLEIDTLGTFNMSQQVFLQSMKQNGGVIINISAALHWNGSVLQAHSASAKAGVDALTRVMAVEWGPYGVRVVGLVPGSIEGTEGFDRLSDIENMNNKEKSNTAFGKQHSQEHLGFLEKFRQSIPLQRMGNVQDIANAGLFLASPLANYITGTLLVVDGGNYLTAPNFMIGFDHFRQIWAQAKL